MFITMKISYLEQEELEKISEILEVPMIDVVELIIKRVLKDKKLIDQVIN